MFVEYIKREEAIKLYNSMRNFVLNSEGHKYESASYLENADYADEAAKKKFTYENTEFKYKNIDDQTIIIRTSKHHHYLRWSKYGRYDNPTLHATVYLVDNSGLNEYEQWHVLVSNDPLDKCFATSPELPLDLIMPMDMNEEKLNELMKVKEKIKD